MAAALIENLRTGQARLDDQLLAEALTMDGNYSADVVAKALLECEPGSLGQSLVTLGELSEAELSRVSADVEVATLMESVGGNTPEAVRDLSADSERRIGRYVLVDELGAGGMGVVWKAWDGKLSRWVALKQVKVQDPQVIRRFMQEAKLLAGLAHPNITQVYEVGVHAGKPFLVMELVDGKPPGGDGPMARKEAASIIADAAQAVHFAHERGIIHRDLKPSNLLVSTQGRVFVTDFGLARMREEGNNLTQSGALLGTPSFMAPEQAQAQAADNRTDIYGLGASLFALVMGVPPHTGELVHEIVKRVAISNPPSIEGNDDLVVVAQKAMERDREDRYERAAELAADLLRFIDDEPIAARPINSVERVWRRAKRRPVFSSTMLALFLSVTLAAGYATSRFALYLDRKAEIAAAQAPIGEAESVASEIKRILQSGQSNGPVKAAAIAKLDALVDKALEVAPGYSEAKYWQGMSALWQGDNDAAIDAFSAALEEDPEHLDARARRTVLLLYKEQASPEVIQDNAGMRVELAELSAETKMRLASLEEELLRLPPDYSIRRLGDSLIHSVRGEFVEQREALSAYLLEHPYDQRARSLVPWALLALGEYAGVEREARLMIESRVFPNIAQYLVALSLGGRGRYDEAIKSMELLIQVQPEAQHYDWVATWAGLNAEPFRAALALEKILAEDPNNIKALLDHASIALELGQLDIAEADSKAVLAIQPNNGVANFFLANAIKIRDPEGALAALNIAIQDPEIAPDALIRLGFYQLDFGDPAASLESFQQASKLTSKPQVAYGLFEANRDLGRGDAALQALAILQGDDHAEYLRAQFAFNNDDVDLALQDIAKSIELAPENALYRLSEARYRIAKSEFAAAETSFAKAHELSPDSSWVFYQNFQIWQEAGAPEKAREVLSRWRQALPDSEDAVALERELAQ
ncbi:MAG: protein kinase [Pseudomonadota bacterium]